MSPARHRDTTPLTASATRARSRLALALLAILLQALPAPGAATPLTGRVTTPDQSPLAEAVIVLTPADPGAKAPSPARPEAIMDQSGKEFVPHVLAVTAGTAVHFPNRDQIQHHVYSFSPAKPFELKLYRGNEAPPVRFDTPGIVALGCNIHDWMLGYIYVADTPFVTLSDPSGQWRIDDLPSGRYQLTLWHPDLDGPPEGISETVEISNGAAPLAHTLALKAIRRTGKPPAAQEGAYTGDP